MSTRHLRARLDRLEQNVKQRQANGSLPLGPADASSLGVPEEPMPEHIELLEIARIVGNISPEGARELERWEAMHPPITDTDPIDPLLDVTSNFELSDEALEKFREMATNLTVRPR